MQTPDEENLTVAKNKSIAIMRSSISGKSTLRHLMGTLDTLCPEKVCLVGLEACICQNPVALTGGEQQCGGLGCAFANQPEIVLANEPMVNLGLITNAAILILLLLRNETLTANNVLLTHVPRAAPFGERKISQPDGLTNKSLNSNNDEIITHCSTTEMANPDV